MKLTIDYGATGLEIAVPDSATVLQMAAGAGLDEVDAGIDSHLKGGESRVDGRPDFADLPIVGELKPV